MHLPNSRMPQQLLPIPPQQLLSHLRLEFDLYLIKILQPALGRDEGVVGAEEEAVLQARGRFAQQRFGNVFG